MTFQGFFCTTDLLYKLIKQIQNVTDTNNRFKSIQDFNESKLTQLLKDTHTQNVKKTF